MTNCALCGSPTVRWKVIKEIPVEDCEPCGHRQADISVDEAHIESVYSDDYFTGGGAGYVDYLAEGPLLVKRGQKYARILSRHLPPGALLDVGAAAGFILEGFTTRGWTGTGIEPNERMAAVARTRGLDVGTGRFDEGNSDLGAKKSAAGFDAISMVQVIAHLADPVGAIGLASRLLRPGGVLLVETWDRDSWAARLAKDGWHEYSPPSVLHWFTKAELNSIAARHRLARIDGGTMAKWITAEHATALLQHSQRNSWAARIAAHFPQRLALPYPGDDLFWVLYQRNP